MNGQKKSVNMTCLKCNQQLTEQKVTFHYIDFPISASLPCCPSCGQVYLPEEFVEGKLSEAEKTLEDK
jgi:NAD-dependent SIR2 family protein deacetylase